MDETPRSAGGGEDAGTRFSRAKEFVGEKYAAASETVRDKYAAASESVKDKYSQVRERVEEIDFQSLSDQVRSYVRSNPGKALLISVGVGFLVGLLLRRDSKEE
ncbi:MAG TPA: DUF883 C-terminal domain-containing protein [Thermoanaerobaculia bacterium]|nr:DUF883 C-terminal domain-containing protein [Thermoanaerobaculia bacterium]